MKTEKVKINGQVELEIEEGMSVSEKNGVVKVSSLETRLNDLMNGMIANMVENAGEKWTPKNGDFVAHTDKYGDTLISIFKGFCPDGTVATHAGVGGGQWRDLLIDDWCLAEWADRPAAESEIKIMNDALAEAGKRWDAEKMQIMDINKKWKPEAGDVVTTISPRGKTISIYKSGNISVGCVWDFYASIHYANGFRVEEQMIDYFGDGKIRPSTYDERCTFFARLVAEGYKWNAKKLKLSRVEKWVPKDGEFVYQKDEECEWISIFKQKTDRDTNKLDVYCSFIVSGKHSIQNTLKMGTSCRIVESGDIFRTATDSERKQLLDALAKEGKRWNAELNRIEDVKPEYKEGDFLRTKSGCVFIYKHKDGILVFDHAFMFSSGYVTISDGPSCDVDSISRHATEQEKQKLLDGLAEIGKKWNATKKRIEDIEPATVEMTMEQVCEKLGMNVKIVKK